MPFDWQLVVVLAIVAGSAWYVARWGWKSWTGSGNGGCSTCNSCDSSQQGEGKQLVALDETHKP